MSFMAPSINLSHTASALLTGVHSFGLSARDTLSPATQKIKDIVTSPLGQTVIGFGLGMGAHRIYGPLTEKIVKALGVSAILPDPFRDLHLPYKIFLAPFVCVLGPILEEKMFRGDLQETLKDKFEFFYLNRGFSYSAANTAARVTSVLFGSIIFGLIHFTNAIVFWCNPVLFLPQVVAATIMGLIFGLAKELSGELDMPVAMHVGNNTLAWAHYMYRP